MTPTARRLAGLLLLAAATLAVAVLPQAASAAKRACKPRAGTVAKDGATRYFHAGRSLYACTTLTRSGTPRTRRLGPWTRGGRLRADGTNVVWTTVRNIDGTKVDRVWAGTAEGASSRWLQGIPAIPASGPTDTQDGKISRLVVQGNGAMWITSTSDVVMTVGSRPDMVTPIGSLPAPLDPDGPALLVGSFPAFTPAQLAQTAILTYDTDEADDCGGTMHHTLTVMPGGGEPAGATWYHAAPADPDICNL